MITTIIILYSERIRFNWLVAFAVAGGLVGGQTSAERAWHDSHTSRTLLNFTTAAAERTCTPWFGRRQPPLGYGSAAVTSCDARGCIRRPLYRPRWRSHARTPTEDPPPTPFADNRCGGDPPKWTAETWRLYTTHTQTRGRPLSNTRTHTPHTHTYYTHTPAQIHSDGGRCTRRRQRVQRVWTRPNPSDYVDDDPKRPRPSDRCWKVGGDFRGAHV